MASNFSLKTSNVDGQQEPPSKPEKPKVEYKEIDDLANLNLGEELLSSYNRASRLFATIEHDEEVPPNQKAQVLNTIRNIQEQILKNQERFYNMERLKQLETVLISTLKQFPDINNAFLDAYEAAGLKADEVKNA